MKLKLYAIGNIVMFLLGITAYTMNRAFEITGDKFYGVATAISCGLGVLILLLMPILLRSKRIARE